MKLRQSQAGITVLGAVALLIVLGFFAMCAIRMAPPYFEYLSVKNIVKDVVLDPELEGASIGTIRRKISNMFNTNQIYETNAKNVEIYRKDGKTVIDASYEVRVPIMWRIDAILRFDDLKYHQGVGTPLDTSSQ
ncbi:MAG: DUF4845 domain-containing protein [Gammaproteobacteria bacterium]|jgi:hypothetical protein|nr:DUF4845 domain-containing protein [Gammaproteobacteria bacterium]